MAETKKTVNPQLIAALIVAVGILVYVICALIIEKFCGARINNETYAGVAIFIRYSGIWSAIILGLVLLLSLLKSTKVIYFVAIGMEFLTAIIGLLFCAPIAIYILNLPDVLLQHVVESMRSSALFILFGSIIAVVMSIRLMNKGIALQLTVLTLAGFITICISYVFMIVLHFGACGNAIWFLQPFCVFPFVAALSNAIIKKNTTRKAYGKSSTFSYLEQYKQKMQNGGK